MDNGIRICDISSSQWGRRVLWVVCWYEFLFTWMEPADGRVGSGPLQGMAADLLQTAKKTVTFLEALTVCAPLTHHRYMSAYCKRRDIRVFQCTLCVRRALGYAVSEGIHNWAGQFLLWDLDDNTGKWYKLKPFIYIIFL